MGARRTIIGVVCAVAGALCSGVAAAQPFVYVANIGADEVVVLDAATLEPVITLPFPGDPNGVAVSPDGRRVYISGFVSDVVGVIDAETQELIEAIRVGTGPVGLAVTPDGARVYVTQRGADSVAAIGVASGTVEAVIPVGRGPNAIAITPDGRSAFVTNSFAPQAGEVSVIDLATDTVRSSIAVGRKPNRVAITPDGRTAYVTNFRSWTSTAIDVASESVRSTFRAGLKSTGVAVNPNGVWGYITDGRGDLLVIDVASDQVTRRIPVAAEASGIGLLRNGGTAYVTDFDDTAIHVVDLGDEEVRAHVEVGSYQFAVAANCVGDGCSEAPYTPKPTKTATETPTITPTPTLTLTVTATASATPTRTLASGQRPVDFTLSFSPIDAYHFTTMTLQLDPGGQVVHGIREQIQLPGWMRVKNTDRLDCILEMGPDSVLEEYSVAVPDSCGGVGGGCAVLSVAIDFFEPITAPTAVYSCVLYVEPASPIGTSRLRHRENTALDADGGALPSRGRDGVFVIGPPVSPSPDLTPRPTRTPTPPRPADVNIQADPLTARPGETVTLTVRLTTGGHGVAGTQNDIELPPGFTIRATARNRPDCTFNPDIDKNGTSFSFQPGSCTPGVDCIGMRALVLSFESVTAIPDGAALYSCPLQIASTVAPGSYSLRQTNLGASTLDGDAIDTGGSPVRVTVTGAAVRRVVAAAARACSGGADDGAACTGDADCGEGLCVVTQGVCDGGDDNGLLCDCAGGRCRAGGASCGASANAGNCDGGVADGTCCDRSFNCRDGACTATHRLCAGGPAKGSPCLNDAQCLGSACLASVRRCAGGEFDGIGCIDNADCPAAACLAQQAPQPTATPTIEFGPPLVASSSDSCAIAPVSDHSFAWWLAPALLLWRRRRH